mmetsp:Transcript_28613/g.45924  ORF Transcript_28613/g.45924 Transcript_28613/m.45924 type:complete len:304 (-) Transcript_28613:99-1010(-)
MMVLSSPGDRSCPMLFIPDVNSLQLMIPSPLVSKRAHNISSCCFSGMSPDVSVIILRKSWMTCARICLRRWSASFTFLPSPSSLTLPTKGLNPARDLIATPATSSSTAAACTSSHAFLYADDGSVVASNPLPFRDCAGPACVLIIRRILSRLSGTRSSHQPTNSPQYSSPSPSASKISIRCSNSSPLMLTPMSFSALSNSNHDSAPLPSGSYLWNTFFSSRVAYAELVNCRILSRTSRMMSRIAFWRERMAISATYASCSLTSPLLSMSHFAFRASALRSASVSLMALENSFPAAPAACDTAA